MRKIKYIVVHCTATEPTATVEAIKKYWKEIRKWDKPGYHYLILRDGEIVLLLDEKEVSYGAYGHNQDSLHISYIGGIDKEGKPIDNRSTLQKHAMFDKLIELSEKYPQAQILGHRDFPGVKKACPSFDVKEWLRNYEPDFKKAA
ncbi:MAG: N-acetylmuramoyl-L-alanine amidase [Bacteroidia bacterium]|nr:N-acetylmuramoyl-L-alanine amidase [Bacteroidia bacterium]